MTAWNSEKSVPVGWARQRSGLSSGAARFPGVLMMATVCVFLSPFAAAQDKNSSRILEPLAVIDGQPIYESQLPPEEQAQLQRMQQQVYAVKLRALHVVLDQKMIEAEAKKKGVSTQDLIKSEVISKVADPSDDQVSAYYQAHQGQINQPFDYVKDKIRQGMKDLEIQKARAVYVQGLMQHAVNDGELVVLLSPPRVEVPVDPARLRGDPKAPVTIVEFSDFSCSYCRKAESTLNELLAKYQGKVKLEYRDFPLRQLHPQAQLAAEASRCAAEQGKFWEYHDLLFANSDKQDRDGLIEHARTLKLDEKQFDACLSSGRYKPQIDQDILIGARGGVVATPGFFVNGTFVNGAQPADAFEKIIDEELAASNSKDPAH
jgi:protein-disulfide isomerase